MLTKAGDDLALLILRHWVEAETGLLQNWHRDYDPSLGRYIEADPLGLDAGQSLYGYVGQDPLGWIDPEGLQKGDLQDALDGMVDSAKGFSKLTPDALGMDTLSDSLDAAISGRPSQINGADLVIDLSNSFMGGRSRAASEFGKLLADHFGAGNQDNSNLNAREFCPVGIEGGVPSDRISAAGHALLNASRPRKPKKVTIYRAGKRETVLF